MYTGDLFEDDPYAGWAVDVCEQVRLTYLNVARRLAGPATEEHIMTDKRTALGLATLDLGREWGSLYG